MTEWNVLEFQIPEWRGRFRWSLEPENWITRRLCHLMKFAVTIDYLQVLQTREEPDAVK